MGWLSLPFGPSARTVPSATWTFTPWGPPGFYQTRSSGGGHLGALQGRRDIGGQRMPGMELSFGVDDIEATMAAIEAGGGKVLMPAQDSPYGRFAVVGDPWGAAFSVMEVQPEE